MNDDGKVSDAKRTLFHYFNVLAEKADINFNADCRVEIQGIIDDIIGAAVEQCNKIILDILRSQANCNKMRCEDCIYASPFEHEVNPFLCNYRALPIRVGSNDFCNHFKVKGVKNNE